MRLHIAEERVENVWNDEQSDVEVKRMTWNCELAIFAGRQLPLHQILLT